jgi:2-polyprenyl-3-methyl-5-hydroxy-6-metoxy-1,4-benzoquinol methylase
VAEALDGVDGTGRRALVVGSALGDDPELVAGLGFDVVAFDVSRTAVTRAKARFPESSVYYRVADLLDPPDEWRQAFDLVVEAITVQSLPPDLREQAIAAIASFVAPGGELLVVSSQAEDHPYGDGPPWPLSRAEVESFARDGLELRSLEDTQQRWRAWFAFSG